MEIFLRGLPLYLHRNGLSREIQPLMERLSIKDYHCEKPKKKNIGTITFLHPHEGEKFFQVYGDKRCLFRSPVDGKRFESRLRIMGVSVSCMRSKRQPTKWALRTLVYAAEQRERDPRQEVNKLIVFDVLEASCGRCDFVEHTLSYTPEVTWKTQGSIKFHDKNMIVDLAHKFRMRIPLSTIIEILHSSTGIFTVTLSDVPFLFQMGTSIEDMIGKLTINGHTNGLPQQQRLPAFDDIHREVVGQCLVYQFTVSPISLLPKIEELKEWDIPIDGYDVSLADNAVLTDFQYLMRELEQYTRNRRLPFNILFQLQALAQNAFLHPRTVSELGNELYSLFSDAEQGGRDPISVEAMKGLFDMIAWPSPSDSPSQYQTGVLLAKLKDKEDEIRDSLSYREGLFRSTSNLARINRVNVTPTRITLQGLEIEPQNRILRKFPKHHEYFIRVQFCDENGEDILLNGRIDYGKVFARFKNIMEHGIQIAGRLYKFLGFSHSSLRSHAVWFSSPFVDENGHLQTYFSIISAIGRLSDITSPAKCAARIGQAFSETPFTIPLDEHGVLLTTVPDLISSDGSRVFSDGIGTLSPEVAEIIWKTLPLKKGTPTGFQVRIGGVKGMLATDSRLSGPVIRIRPSMTKFESKDLKSLEICNTASRPYPLVLNRQVIKILEDMGAPDPWFFELQQVELDRLEVITRRVDKAAEFLQHKSVAECIGLYRVFQFCNHLGLNFKKDRLLRSIVEAVVLRELLLLKYKARIPVRNGMTLYGVIDETGLLEENEVYVTFDTMHGRHASPPRSGPLLVARSPALHDGDIQRAQNVVPPNNHPLRNHRNCIVFSQKGTRDLPSQLSGGDLDGDLYHVFWDSALAHVRTFAPADYPRVPASDIGRVVEVDDMAGFFVDFMSTDILGLIAVRHMIVADQSELGTCDPMCRKLAELHSTAVDFSKTGIPVRMGDLPTINCYRPDFLAPGPKTRIHNKLRISVEDRVSNAAYDDNERPNYAYYKSDKILGRLFRSVNEKNILFGRGEEATDEVLFWEELIAACTERCKQYGRSSWQQHIGEAKRMRATYEDAITTTMDSFSDHPTKPISELEVVIGCIIGQNGAPTRRQRDRSVKLQDEFERIATWITGSICQKSGTAVESLEFCLACVHAGNYETDSGRHRRKDIYGELRSFRIVAACALLAALDLVTQGNSKKFVFM
ncbi:RNA dependent RNA polymerase-domain-containing protein [Aspergillus avenaceus]|uniref:RNA-dependent RNA polymerase n=1 Tax=Aspergillus avenaceus TaxID=36643 RepID=A0A5N6TTX3_ASPAV|nr:RNA dependent RNA polymerase-domain-containing protein [Aspergillus avenaceus]